MTEEKLVITGGVFEHVKKKRGEETLEIDLFSHFVRWCFAHLLLRL